MSNNVNISNAYHAIEICEPSIRPDRIVLRREQEDAVKMAMGKFKDWEPGKETKFLWNAKMRFGKTVSALKLAKELGQLAERPVRRTIIVTHRPDVEENWRTDFENIFTEEERESIDFATKFDGDNNDITSLINNTERGLVFFASMQYLRGSKLVGGKNGSPTKDMILTADWDLIVVDEAHEGTLTDLGSGVINLLTNGHKRRLLSLSGTPFNLFENFAKSEIFTWDYVMEQERKLAWPNKPENKGKPEAANPYRTLPKMEIRILEPKKVMHEHWANGFDLREFFRVDDSKEARRRLSEELEEWKARPKDQRGPRPTFHFVHEDDVYEFLSRLSDDSDLANSYPFANPESRAQLRHTFWVLPGVKECKAMKNLLERHPFYREFDDEGNRIQNAYRVINVAGNREGDEERANALDVVKENIKEITEQGLGIGTITLSCGRLTTGVTIPQWTAVIYLKGSTSTKASTYMQTIFRVQSPWEFVDSADLENKMKKTCYVFDFDPTRTLNIIAETAKYSAMSIDKRSRDRAQYVDEDTRDSLAKFLKYCQVCDMSGDMIERDTEALVHRLVEHLHSVAIEKAVHSGFDNKSIYNMQNLLSDPPEKLEAIRDVVGETDPEAKKDKNKPRPTGVDIGTVTRNGGTPGENGGKKPKKGEEETPEQKAAKEAADRLKQEANRRVAILRGIAIRIPLLMYGADGNSECTITLDNITDENVVDHRSWNEFMPKGVTPELFKELKHYFDRTVFDGAGRRYRELTREADSMPITERVARIAEIQSWFRNPNSETVLTPWPVVNRHLSETIGGYCFYNESFTGPNQVEVTPEPGSGKLFEYVDTIEPREVKRGEITERVFRVADDNHSTLLEINSKSGLYPLFLVYTLYRKRLEQYLKAELIASESELSVEEQQVIWDDAVSLCLHIICNTPMAEYITRRTLLGFRQCDNEIDKALYESEHPGRIGFIRSNLKIRHLDLVEQARDRNIRQELVDLLRSPSFWSNDPQTNEPMKFDAVVSNPPYNRSRQGDSTGQDPVYHNFIDLSMDLADYGTLIHPARFLFRRGATPSAWMNQILNDDRFAVVDFFPNSKDIFDNVEIKGGIAITQFSNVNPFGAIREFISEKALRTITSKVKESKFKCFAEIIYGRDLYKLTKAVYEAFPETEGRQSKGHAFDLGTSIFRLIPEIFESERPDDVSNYAQILGRENDARIWRWVRLEYVKVPDNFLYYKLICPKANGSGKFGESLTVPIIGNPGEGHTGTFISIGKWETIDEAKACQKYFCTKFARTLLGQKKVTQDITKNAWDYVPLQDFTSGSDIPWDKSVAEIDQYLYHKYGFEQEEIEFIESMIKPME